MAAEPATARRGGLVRQSGLTSVAAAASILAGLLLQVVIASTFGAGRSTDAFFAAARLPLGLVAVLTAAANQALVPAITTSLVRRGDAATWRTVSALLSWVVLALTGVALAAGVAARPLMAVLAPGFDAAQLDQAADVARVIVAIVPLVGAAEVLRAVLDARYSFVAPAAMTVVLGLVASSVILLASGADVRVVAWAYVAGTAAQLAFLAAVAARRGFRFRPGLGRADREVAGLVRLCGRPLTAASLNPVARIGEQLLVSFLPPGSVTILNYGYTLVSAVGGTVFFRSVVVAVVPRMSEAAARGDDDAVARLTASALRIMLALSLPLTAAMGVLAGPAAVVVFARGDFSRADAVLLGATLSVYAASLVGSAVQRALLGPFYARLDTRTPLRNTVLGVGTNLALLVPVAVLLRGHDGAVLAVAAAYAASQYVHVAHAAWCLRRTTSVRVAGVGGVALRLAGASAAAAVAMAAVGLALDLWSPAPRLELAAGTAAAGLAGAAVLAAVLLLLARRGGDDRATVAALVGALRRARPARTARTARTAPAAPAAGGPIPTAPTPAPRVDEVR